MSDTVVVHAEERFEQRRREHEMNKMKCVYNAFNLQLEHFLKLEHILSYNEIAEVQKNCKQIYDTLVDQMLTQKKSPYNEDFLEFLNMFEDEIKKMTLSRDNLVAKVIELLQISKESLF